MNFLSGISQRLYAKYATILQATLSSGVDINKTAWNHLVESSPQGSIFMETGFLDTLLPGQWIGIEIHDGESLQAVMPINIRTKMGLRYGLQPHLSKYWGIAFKARPFHSTYKQLGWQKKVINAAIGCIPPFLAAFEYNCHPGFEYTLPFFWHSFDIKVRSTYVLDVCGWPEARIFDSYAGPMKNSLKKAQKNDIRIVADTSAQNLIHVLEQNRYQGKFMLHPAHYKTLENLLAYGKATDKCFGLSAFNDLDIPLASALYLKDKHRVYSLVHCMDKKYSHTDAFSLITHHAITHAANQNLKFDFLGSMIEPVESGFRKFNGKITPYYIISRKNPIIRLLGK